MHYLVLRLTALLTALYSLTSPLPNTAIAAPTPADAQTIVLDTSSFWRMHHTIKPPVTDVNDQLKPYLKNVTWLDGNTSAPATNWMTLEFDDSTWLRTTGRGSCQTPYLARQCIRGKFKVTNRSQVKNMRLSIDYHGGVIVYLNGKELTRKHLPVTNTNNALADAYPLEVYLAASGDLLANSGTYTARGRKAGKPDADSQKRMAMRIRSIKDFVIPRSVLKKGVNILAIELVRSAYHKVLLESNQEADGKNRHNKFDWNTCELIDIQLTTMGNSGLQANRSRPNVFQVWNSDPMASDSKLDYGDQNEPLAPIKLVGAKNGLYSGKVMIGSSKPITGLKVKVSDLKSSTGRIPASMVRVRYGYAWGQEAGFTRSQGSIKSPYTTSPGFFGAVINSPPSKIPVNSVRKPQVGGAVIPIWVTIRTPKQISSGSYKGKLTITVDGKGSVNVPIILEVLDYTLADSQNYRTWVELIQSPDTLAAEYNLPLWSDKHFKMIGESFSLMKDTGTRVVHIPAVAHTNLGNAQSMIRWISKGENLYEWDFSIMERYLDLAREQLGQPKVVVLQVWEIYMSSKISVGKRFGAELDQRKQASGGRPLVTILDPVTGKTHNAPLPDFTDPESKQIWGSLLKEIRSRLHDRGMEQALMLGMFTDAVPPEEHLQFFHDLVPDLPWVHQGHGRWQKKVYGITEVGYQTTVWGGFRFADGLRQTNQKGAPIVKSLHGWKEPRLDAVFERNTGLDRYPPTRWRYYAETGITGELRGVGRIGADYWKVVKNKKGRRVGWAHERFMEGGWGGSSINLNLCSSTLAPGPNGPVATTRMLAFIEGIQECEARITIEQALTDESLKAKLGQDLAERCQDSLDRRLQNMWRALSNYQLGGPFFFKAGAWRWAPGIPGHRWFLSNGWQEKSKELYELAGEVQRKLEQ